VITGSTLRILVPSPSELLCFTSFVCSLETPKPMVFSLDKSKFLIDGHKEKANIMAVNPSDPAWTWVDGTSKIIFRDGSSLTTTCYDNIRLKKVGNGWSQSMQTVHMNDGSTVKNACYQRLRDTDGCHQLWEDIHHLEMNSGTKFGKKAYRQLIDLQVKSPAELREIDIGRNLFVSMTFSAALLTSL
jgi:hypothetical protein